jgi:NADP-dependent 3-hydroxy acid dehydrogenase YdfG
MSNPVVLITGCSSGIGKELAFEFKRKGCRVFASARNVDKLGELKSADIDVVQLDVANVDSVQVIYLPFLSLLMNYHVLFFSQLKRN